IALVVGGCGAPPGTDQGTSPAATGAPAGEVTAAPAQAVEGFLPCIVSGEGGFNDRSFNQSAFEGLQAAASHFGLQSFPNVTSNSVADYIPNIQSLLGQNCSLITAISFNLAPATVESAHANPNVHYLLVDDSGVIDGEQPPDNLKSVLFNTAEAAFLAGYLAAGYSAREGGAHHVGTFGGANFPTVTIFMDGFRQGVEYYNSQNDANVQFTGWDGYDGSFTGNFQAGQQAQAMAQGIIDQGVDVILPVGGPIYQSAVAAITDSNRDVALIGVDMDLFYTDPSTQPVLLTSILKNVSGAVENSVIESGNGNWTPTPYVGDLANDGVGLAPFHNFDSQIPQDLRGQIEQLRQDIIAGNVVVESYLG
ncbi:MAG: BMP family ABC transporter substrate-binding protein, partial [Cellulomonadaceae bacterium]|nr:BMP family ABC transporter substrate-binding protein [Cellulomonadaceae bacterium]